MRSSRFVRNICICVAAAYATACAESRIAPFSKAAHSNVAQSASVSERVIYSFAGGKDGKYPQGAPILLKGTLYGTTVDGGRAGCAHGYGCGTVYAIGPSGNERVVYAFNGRKDGEAPNGALLPYDGNLVGTTVLGGISACKNGESFEGCGTVFEITADEKERVLYRFPGKGGGALPVSALTLFGGELFGEAAAGGMGTCYYEDVKGCGVIFAMRLRQNPKIVYTFQGGKDGGAPQGSLIALKDSLYGTGSAGGGTACYFSYGCGTAFSVTSDGMHRTLHAFGRSLHTGALPETGLVSLNNSLFGTTFSGGPYDCALTGSFIGCGTVFRLGPTGDFKTIYSFTGRGDGAYPNGVIAVDGNLYGTSGSSNGSDCGFFFEITPAGKETTLYPFAGGSDGCGPSSLLYADGRFYGTTYGGGAHGDGTVFAITL